MGKLDDFRKIFAMPEVIQNVELTNQLRELQTDYFELLEKNNELNNKLKKVEEISDIKKNAKINSGFYTLDDVKDIHGDEICFCLNCLYEHNLQIPMNFGVVQNGIQDAISQRVFRPTTYGLICNKCGCGLAIGSNKEKNNG